MHTRLTQLLCGGWLAAALVVMAAEPALAGGSGKGWSDDRSGEIGAGAGKTGSTGGGAAGGGAGGSGGGCEYIRLSDGGQQTARELAEGGWADKPQGEGAYYRKVCGGVATVVFLAAPPPAVDPRALALEALDRAFIPLPGAQTSPPAGADQVVNLPTWLWTDNWRSVSASASAGGVTATVTARPVRTVWAMGAGAAVTCAGPGTPYSEARAGERPACSYTYRESSAGRPGERFAVSATTSWHVTWVATGAATAGGDFGEVNRTTGLSLRVAEIQTVHE